MVRDDLDEKNGRSRPGRDVGFGAKSPRINRRKYPNAPCCIKAYISHKIRHVFNFADFLFVKKELTCDKKQIDDVKMKFVLIAQR